MASSAASWKAGVRSGMPLAEARSMAAPLDSQSNSNARRRRQPQKQPETVFLEWQPEEDRTELIAAAELTRRFAPIVGLDESPVPDCLLLDITGCGSLFGGESALAEQLLHRLDQNGFECRAAISDSVSTAWAFVHPAGHFLQQSASAQRFRISPDWDLPVIVIPPQQSETWLHSLPVASGRIPLKDIDLLSQLGILTIRQLLSLPMADLPSRLSDEAIHRIRHLQGVDEELITAIPEARPVASTWVSEFAATNQAEIRQVVEHLTEEACAELQRRNTGAVRLTCLLRNERREEMSLTAEVIRPLQDAADFLSVMNLQLEKLRLPDPIFSAELQAITAPLPVARQKDLFSASEHIDPAEELTDVVNRLSNRLGKHAVLTAEPEQSAIPESVVKLRPLTDHESRQSVEDRLEILVTPTENDSAKKLPPNRPLRLLPTPQPITQCDGDPLQNAFLWNGQTHTPVTATAPERIQTEWWQETAVHRDYFRIHTDVGSAFWVFQDLRTKAWYVHGLFE